MCFYHNVQRTVHHHALTQEIGLHPRKLTWPMEKENCTYLKMAIFPLTSNFTGKESWNIPPSNPFWVPSHWTWLVIFVQGTIFLFDQKSTFPSQLGFGSVVVSAATGQPYPEVPGCAANHQRCFRTKKTGTTYVTFENHGFKSAEKDMLVPRKIRCELAFPPCEPLGNCGKTNGNSMHLNKLCW